MKRLFFFALNALLFLSLSSCGSGKEDDNSAPKPKDKTPAENPVVMPTTITGKVYLAGDSLVCPWPENDSKNRRGWGQYLADSLKTSPSGAVPNVVNKAISGRSTKSFITEGDWNSIMSTLAQNDLVLIQFAANDGSTADKGCTPEEYATNLKKFISEAREKGAWPVLVTPPNPHKPSSSGNIQKYWTSYTNTMRNVANETLTALVDCQNMSYEWLRKNGQTRTAEYYIEDETHLTLKGASLFAGMIANSMKEQGLWP